MDHHHGRESLALTRCSRLRAAVCNRRWAGAPTVTSGPDAAGAPPPRANGSQGSWETSASAPGQAAAEANASATAVAEVPSEPLAEQVPQPHTPSPPMRKSSARDVLLPPY